MIVVVITCVVVIGALVVANLRLRDRWNELESFARDTAEERDRAREEAATATTAVELAQQERDEALDRVSRARRDAAEVANRLSAEASARVSVEEELVAVRDELHEARSAGVGGLADRLWHLSVRQAEHTWRLSVAVDPDADSPFGGEQGSFRTAVEIELDAAREESGAVFEVEWTGEAEVPTGRAVVGMALIRDLVNALGTTADQTTLTISSTPAALEISVAATDAGGAALSVDLPAELESAPGVARIE